MLITEKPPKPKNGGKKTVAILFAIGVHFLIAVIAAIIAVMPGMKDEPEIVAQVINPMVQKEMKIQRKEIQKQAQQASSSSASASVARLIRSNAIARIAAPEVKDLVKGPLGLGTGELGDGFGMGSGLGGGGGGGATMFGRTGGGGLEGTLYDLKQSPSRKPTGFNPGNQGAYFGALSRYYGARFSAREVAGYYRAKQKMSFTYLVVPNMSANEGPKAFNVEKEVQPRGWFVHYHGRLKSPKSGDWRWVGMFDDALYVFVNGKMVLNGSFQGSNPGVSNPFGGPALGNGKAPYAGSWVRLGSSFEIDIIVGERPGGVIGGGLLVQRKGEKYETRGGVPILPVFSTVRIGSSDLKRINKHPYGFAKNTPVFSPVY